MIKATSFNIDLEFQEPILGSCPKDPDVYKDFITSKLAKRKDLTGDEIEAAKTEEAKELINDIQATEERGWTGFLVDEEGAYLMNYCIRGFFKSALAAMQENGSIGKIVAYKTKVDRFLHIRPRKLHFTDSEGNPIMVNGNMEVMERPLRAMTMQGPRVSLARSDCLPAGTHLKFRVDLLDNKGITEETIKAALEWGQWEGIGQWRSGGYGQFNVISVERCKE